MSFILDKDAGLYDPTLRFAFTNITEEDLVSAWGGSPIIVKAGQTVELPHHLADKLTDELVNRIMIEDVRLEEVKGKEETRNPYFRSQKGANLGVPEARKVWEEQIVRQLEVDEESPEVQVMRAQIKEELMADLSREKSTEPVQVPTLDEFAGLNKEPEKPVEKKPLKMKEIK